MRFFSKSKVWVLLIGLMSAFGFGSTKSALDYVSLTRGKSCNEPDVPGETHYLINKNKKRAIRVKLKVTNTSSQGSPSEEIESLEVPAAGHIDLGCDRAGSGVPIVVDTDWTILEAKFK